MEKVGSNLAKPWLREAASLPLAFAQVREDPRLDLKCVAPGAHVAMIASGGDTVAVLSRLKLGRLVVVDINPAQLALTRLKLRLSREFSREDAMGILGHAPMPAAERAERIADELSALGPSETLATLGPDFAGRYELLFAELRRELAERRLDVRRWLESPQSVVVPPGTEFDAAFENVMSLENLVALFGTEATRNPVRPFAAHFADRARIAFQRSVPCENPFLWQIFAGEFPPSHPWDWLSPEQWSAPVVEPEYVHGRMKETLHAIPAASLDFVHLSNILDWLSPEDGAGVLDAARRALRRGGRVLIRQLNSSLDIRSLPCDICWNSEESSAMEQHDRSFFYPQIHLGEL